MPAHEKQQTTGSDSFYTDSGDFYTQLLSQRKKACRGGGPEKTTAQHRRGKLTARERIEILLDKYTFREFDLFRLHNCNDFSMETKRYYGDGAVTGTGTIFGRRVFVYAQDFTVLGGSLSIAQAEKICKVIDAAASAGAPIIALNDSGGARVQEGIDSLAGYGNIFRRNVAYSGVIPQITAIMGPCAGGAVYSPAVQDIIFMTKKTSYMFVTGPRVVKAVLHEETSTEDLGGADMHSSKSGVAHIMCETENELITKIREFVNLLPLSDQKHSVSFSQISNSVKKKDTKKESIFRKRSEEATNKTVAITHIVPTETKKPYDMHLVIQELTDDRYCFEISPQFASNIICCLSLMGGQTVGFIANQPKIYAGVLDINASRKAARFIRFCDAFSIPIVTLVDVPGFMPGKAQEQNGIITNGAKLLYAYSEATVPKITVIIRKAYGGAYIVMNSRHLGADAVAAWPSAEIAVMGAEGAVEVIYHQLGSSSEDEAIRRKKIEEYTDFFLNPYRAAEKGYIDSIILPEETRKYLLDMLEVFKHKKCTIPDKIHGNIPL